MTEEIRQRYGHLVVFAMVALISLSLFRVALLGLNFDRVEATLVPQLLLFGLRFDLLVVGYLLIPPLFLVTLAPGSFAASLSRGLRVYYVAALLAIMVMEAIGVGFLFEYDHRPDMLFWEYLKYPDEVSKMLLGGYLPEIGITLLTATAAFALGRKLFIPRPLYLRPNSGIAGGAMRIAMFFVIAVSLTLSIRSSLGHRPANVSTAIFSDNRLANELALNSFYTAAYARYSRRHDSDTAALYGSMDFQEAIDLVFSAQVPADAIRDHGGLPTMHRIPSRVSVERPRNVVIILEESLGARFVGALGGADLTPNFDRLSKSGVLFTNLYATGTRTTRGIEAVLSGYPPSASQSVVKRGKSRRDFFTLAQLLGEHGYRSTFLYGGEANFDDMGAFMLGNGFDSVVAGAAEYPDAQFVGSWGVSDEDWVRRAHKQFEMANREGPFFGLMLSTSNHSPWEFPDGRIEHRPGPIATRENSIRYADYALGEFFALAEASDYYDNTIFLVVADHDSRVYGDAFVPIDYFHIPGLLIGKDLEPGRYERIASQIDLLPTILPLLGISVDSPTIGQDLFAPGLEGPGRALMQYGRNNAYMRGDAVVVRLPGMAPKQFRRNADGSIPVPVDPELARVSLAYLTLAHELYERQAYRSSASDSPTVAATGYFRALTN